MSTIAPDYIAGRLTARDWYDLRDRLSADRTELWQEAFADYFEERLRLRYLHPIRLLQENGTFQGEGFSIVAIQCSLIEFLESTAKGTNYRYLRRGSVLGPFEYSSSKAVFVSFLTAHAPFSNAFDAASAEDFYEGVRCGLLHEARTKNGWRIWAKHGGDIVADPRNRIVYRDNFQEGLLTYIRNYGQRLLHDRELQAAFIRKFDSLCT